jgi:hypothetical protein
VDAVKYRLTKCKIQRNRQCHQFAYDYEVNIIKQKYNEEAMCKSYLSRHAGQYAARQIVYIWMMIPTTEQRC